MSKIKTVEDIIGKLKGLKSNLVFSGSLLSKLSVSKVLTNVFAFDYATRGGIPFGKITQFHGTKSSAKTTFSFIFANSFLEQFPDKKVVFFDFEHSFNFDWCKNFIKDMERFVLVSPDYGEQGVDFLIEFAHAEDVGLIINDSVSMMIPTAEADSSATDDFVGLQARLVNKMLRKLIVCMSNRKRAENPLTVLLINQIRSAIGARAFQPQTSLPGGKMLEHIVCMDVKFFVRNYEKVGDTPVRCNVGFSVEKNKVGLPKVSGEFKLYISKTKEYNVGFIPEAELIFNYAKKQGIIYKEGKKWFCNDVEFANQAVIMDAIINNKELQDALKFAILDKINDSEVLDDSEEVIEES